MLNSGYLPLVSSLFIFKILMNASYLTPFLMLIMCVSFYYIHCLNCRYQHRNVDVHLIQLMYIYIHANSRWQIVGKHQKIAPPAEASEAKH